MVWEIVFRYWRVVGDPRLYRDGRVVWDRVSKDGGGGSGDGYGSGLNRVESMG